ncbi:MAG: hypothetical protein F6K40_26260 [Okeania sp. SIO3I5]|uniref:hypothetical protein n=1 Tax=Okeania sp. SIO3I5 TaxID=2607805 RepID=UPI0013BBC530|nr:hypothetical protein [Okeania sp. SIO3I5]NEQ39569.1 hypothetical protein [Okeania sp. SIO3I5]
MSEQRGFPIEGYDLFIERFDSLLNSVAVNNSKLQELINIFRPTRLSPKTKDTSPEAEEMPIQLTVETHFPTGSRFELPVDFFDFNGADWLRDKLDSKLGIDGHKIFAFPSFDPNISSSEGYDFLVEIDPNFTTLDVANPPYIQCHLFNAVRVSKILLMMLGGWGENMLGYFPESFVGWVKKGNFAGELSSHPGTIILKPHFLAMAGFFSVKIENEGWKSAVIKYDSKTKTFTLLGY